MGEFSYHISRRNYEYLNTKWNLPLFIIPFTRIESTMAETNELLKYSCVYQFIFLFSYFRFLTKQIAFLANPLLSDKAYSKMSYTIYFNASSSLTDIIIMKTTIGLAKRMLNVKG